MNKQVRGTKQPFHDLSLVSLLCNTIYQYTGMDGDGEKVSRGFEESHEEGRCISGCGCIPSHCGEKHSFMTECNGLVVY